MGPWAIKTQTCGIINPRVGINMERSTETEVNHADKF
jgi:hypothetical protein